MSTDASQPRAEDLTGNNRGGRRGRLGQTFLEAGEEVLTDKKLDGTRGDLEGMEEQYGTRKDLEGLEKQDGTCGDLEDEEELDVTSGGLQYVKELDGTGRDLE